MSRIGKMPVAIPAGVGHEVDVFGSQEAQLPQRKLRFYARMFFAISHNIAELADVLGHSSIETTRIYLRETGQAHRLKLEKLKLVS